MTEESHIRLRAEIRKRFSRPASARAVGIKHRIPRECLDAKGNLKPESPCAKKIREARMNSAPLTLTRQRDP